MLMYALAHHLQQVILDLLLLRHLVVNQIRFHAQAHLSALYLRLIKQQWIL